MAFGFKNDGKGGPFNCVNSVTSLLWLTRGMGNSEVRKEFGLVDIQNGAAKSNLSEFELAMLNLEDDEVMLGYNEKYLGKNGDEKYV